LMSAEDSSLKDDLSRAVDTVGSFRLENCDRCLVEAFVRGFDQPHECVLEARRLQQAQALLNSTSQLAGILTSFGCRSNARLAPLTLLDSFYTALHFDLDGGRQLLLGGAGAVLHRHCKACVTDWLMKLLSLCGGTHGCERGVRLVHHIAGAVARRACLMSRRPIDRDDLCMASLLELTGEELHLGREQWASMASRALPLLHAVTQYLTALRSGSWPVEMIQSTEVIELGRLTRCLLDTLPDKIMNGARDHSESLCTILTKYDALYHRQVIDVAISAWLKAEADECISELQCVARVLQSEYSELSPTSLLATIANVSMHRAKCRLPHVQLPTHLDDDGTVLCVDASVEPLGVDATAFPALRLLAVVAFLEQQHAFEAGVVSAQLCSECGVEVMAVASLAQQHIHVRGPAVRDVTIMLNYMDAASCAHELQGAEAIDSAVSQLAFHSLDAIRSFCSDDGNLERLAEHSKHARLLRNAPGAQPRIRALLDTLLVAASRRRARIGICESQAVPVRELLLQLRSVQQWCEERRSGVPSIRLTVKLREVRRIPRLEQVLRQFVDGGVVRVNGGSHRVETVTLCSSLLLRVF
jgi:hypothetical protein